MSRTIVDYIDGMLRDMKKDFIITDQASVDMNGLKSGEWRIKINFKIKPKEKAPE